MLIQMMRPLEILASKYLPGFCHNRLKEIHNFSASVTLQKQLPFKIFLCANFSGAFFVAVTLTWSGLLIPASLWPLGRFCFVGDSDALPTKIFITL